MAYQNALILLFLLLQISQIIDPSHKLDKCNVSVDVDWEVYIKQAIPDAEAEWGEADGSY